MEIVDLDATHLNAYLNCLEEWSEEMAEAGDHKKCWYRNYSEKGLRVKIALDDEGAAIGMIQYLPIEESIVEGSELYFIPCIWVHGHKEGVGNRQGSGVGSALLEAAEDDVRVLGAKGMAAWGLSLPFWMKASWYKKHGYKKVDRDSISLLLVKQFTPDAAIPRWIRRRKAVPTHPGKVTVSAFNNGWCQVQNIVYERVKRACAEIGDRVIFDSIDTSNQSVFLEWGISDGIYIDGKKVAYGPPPSYEKLREKISRRARRLRSK